jgi:hypothetical protein
MLVEFDQINMEVKKIIAREFLLLLFSAVLVGLIYGYYSIYNWNTQRKITDLTLDIKQLEAEEVYKSFTNKKSKRIDFFSGYRMYLLSYSEESREYVYQSDHNSEYYRFWPALFKFVKGNNSPSDWKSTGLPEVFVQYCKSSGFSSPEEFYSFTNDLYWTNLEVQNVRSINSIIRSKNSEIKGIHLYSGQEISYMMRSAVLLIIGLVFGLRYLIYLTFWSVRTIRI